MEDAANSKLYTWINVKLPSIRYEITIARKKSGPIYFHELVVPENFASGNI